MCRWYALACNRWCRLASVASRKIRCASGTARVLTRRSRTECERDLPPANRASRSLVKFVFGEEDEHEEALYGTANHRVSEGSRGRYAGQGTVQEARVQ
ncbi:alkyl hydroperoxide reductase [Burkholderia cenocepacia]|nr:alkyl hydroperoxide reductase [Burkholderia cenocepacia]ONX70118.1 alkyl hydroperoxide reductase [Burkholderia cenocepacia]ONX83908.1 alkyl hydroperoxide reductase [Burkholderia cenocepacia]ONX86307.1 alkyl hydroperoxide reductase [Burkholderia cenocepacia]ONX92018.1 alkyl hydroperoxide reductase [Burkholderia cenocepacia]